MEEMLKVGSRAMKLRIQLLEMGKGAPVQFRLLDEEVQSVPERLVRGEFLLRPYQLNLLEVVRGPAQVA